MSTSVKLPVAGPPVAKVQPKVSTIHGNTLTDNYFWLREKSNPEVLAYLEAENAYAQAIMQHTEPLQDRLYREMLGRIQETDCKVPEKIDDYYYYTRTEAGQAYKIHCRKTGSLNAPEEILLDENHLAAGCDFFQLGVYKVSPNHQLLAYSVDTAGNETFTLYVKDLMTGQLRSDAIPNTYYSAEWANDNRTLFYNVLDSAKRPYRLYRHTLGTDSADDVLVYEEPDEIFFLLLSKTRSKAYLVLKLLHKAVTEMHVLDASQPENDFQIVQPRQVGLEYYIDHHDNRFFIVTNDQAENNRVMTAPVTALSKENWQEFIPHRSNVKIEGIAAFQNHLVMCERQDGLPTFQVIHLPTGQSHTVDFPEVVYTCWPHTNPEFNIHTFRFSYSSLVTPESVFDYNMNDGTCELKKREDVLGGYNPALYQTELSYATAPDGVKVPVSLVYKKGLVKNGQNPTLLYGYGSYEALVLPKFLSYRLSLLDRGFVFAIAHIRGGGKLGRRWYRQGKVLQKINTFTDFIACAEHMIANKYTSSKKLAIMGRSAGGLLMGAVTNMRPDLFKVVVAQVPFVDVINTMLDTSIPLTTTEYEEWGNPNSKEEYDYIKTYSPYDNVASKDYPNMLVTAGLHDSRVAYWEPAKWVAKLRALKTDKNILLLKTDLSAGHSGPSDRYEYLKEMAFIYAFILDRLGADD